VPVTTTTVATTTAMTTTITTTTTVAQRRVEKAYRDKFRFLPKSPKFRFCILSILVKNEF